MAKHKGSNQHYQYVGGGYVPGVPARDLTPEEYEQHAFKIEHEREMSGITLYVPKDAAADPATIAAEEAGEVAE